jgi:hypothetical protein
MRILKETALDWRERRFVRELCMDQSVKVRLGQGQQRSMIAETGIRQESCLSPIPYSECLTKGALEGFGGLEAKGKVIRTVKYADDLVLLAKERTMLEYMIY